MQSNFITPSQSRAARVAGLIYSLIIITNILSLVFIDSQLFVSGDITATISKIRINELLYRFDIAYKIVMYFSVVMLSVALYIVLKEVNRNLALLALAWRLAEAILGCLTVVSSFIILLLIQDKEYSLVFAAGQLAAFVKLFLDLNLAITAILFVFLSLGSIVFCYLFLKSNYIPRVLAIFGIVSFLITLIGTFINILMPIKIWMLFGVPAILFELTAGVWLLFKGIRVR